jgi:hypothetical protein
MARLEVHWLADASPPARLPNRELARAPRPPAALGVLDQKALGIADALIARRRGLRAMPRAPTPVRVGERSRRVSKALALRPSPVRLERHWRSPGSSVAPGSISAPSSSPA